LYEQIVLPEIKRMMLVKKDDEQIEGYEPSYLYFLPSLNTLKINNKELKDLILDGNGLSSEVTLEIKKEIQNIFDTLVEEKKQDWERLGIGKTDKSLHVKNAFIDKSYFTSIKKPTVEAKLDYAVKDYVYNYLISNVEAYKVFVGDPALYFKKAKSKGDQELTIQDHMEETFINIGKRLAADIAPG